MWSALIFAMADLKPEVTLLMMVTVFFNKMKMTGKLVEFPYSMDEITRSAVSIWSSMQTS